MKLIALFLAGVMMMSGCVSDGETPLTMSATPLTDVVTPVVQTPSADYRGSDWTFALELAKKCLEGQEENPVISPLSAWLALSMAANGAAGETAKAFAQVLGMEEDALNAANLGRIQSLLDTDGQTALSIANSIWVDDGLTADKDFLQRVVDYYAAQVYGMDLGTREAMDAMNSWINDQTRGMIPAMFSEPLPAETASVLVNTLYMKAKWRSVFWENTYQRPFTLAGGSAVDAEFMVQTASFPYVEKDGVKGIELPYDDGRLSFYALMPEDAAEARELLAGLDEKALQAYFSLAEDTRINLSMPKFTVEYTVDMKEALTAMGLENAFTPGAADLSRLGSAGTDSLYIDAVMQKVKVIVDEEGTEAAAATAVIVAPTSMPVETPLALNLDRPFVYVIADHVTGSILFAGILTNPAA